MVLTIALVAVLGGLPTPPANTHNPIQYERVEHIPLAPITSNGKEIFSLPKKNIAVDLHSMTAEEQKLFPGRERFDKTEWYESLFKSAKIVVEPEHVDEWHNGGVDLA